MENKRESFRRILDRWGHVPVFCAIKQAEVDDYRGLLDSAVGLSPVAAEGMPRSNAVGRPTERSAERMMKLFALYDSQIDLLVEQIRNELIFEKKVTALLNTCLTIYEKTILEMRYKRGKTFAEIAQELDRAEGSIKSVEAKAVDKLCDAVEIEIL